MLMGWFNLASLFFLSFVVAFVFGLNEHDRVRPILRATVRRWVKLLVGLVVIGIVVQILSHI